MAVKIEWQPPDALAPQPSGTQHAAQARGRLVDALRAAGKPVA